MISAEYEAELKKFLRQLNEKNLNTSTSIALASVRLIKKLIGETRCRSTKDLETIVRNEFKRLFSILPSQTIVHNICKRILKIIQDETLNVEQQSSIQTNLLFQATLPHQISSDINELKPRIFEAIGEIEIDIETSISDISTQALEHIHSNEIILTMGKSTTVFTFLERAAKKRKFHVIIAENEPYLEEHELALNLSKLGLDVTLITHSAILSCISRVNKIIIGTHIIYANGALKAKIGTNALALAAKYHNIPVIVCAQSFKLTPTYNHSCINTSFNSSDDVLALEFRPNVTVLNPQYDYVSPDLIGLFIFNSNSNAPSYVYRLIREMYPSIEDETEHEFNY